MTALNYSDIGVVGTLVVLSFAQFACCLLCFSAPPTKRLFWFLVTAAVPYAANTLIEVFFTLTDFDLQRSLHPSQTRLLAQIFYLGITVTLCGILAHLPATQRRYVSAPIRWGLLGVLAVLFFCLGNNLGLLNNSGLAAQTADGLVLNDIGLLVSSMAVILLFDGLSSSIQQQMELSQTLELQHLHEAERKRAEAAVRTWRHDMRRALEPIAFFAAAGDVENIRKYLGDLNVTVDALGAGISTGIPGLDAELMIRKVRAQSLGIPMQVTAERIELTEVNSARLSIAAANLLDNSIEACQDIVDSADRFIDVSVYCAGSMAVIDILNSASGRYHLANRRLHSTKANGDHGHGFDQLQRLVEESGGYYITEPREDSFRVLIYLPLREKERKDD